MISKLRAMTKKQLILMVAALSMFGVIGASSMTMAAPAGKPTTQQCAAAGYSNYGQCVRQWGQGNGYGGNGGGNGGGQTDNGHSATFIREFFKFLASWWNSFFNFWR